MDLTGYSSMATATSHHHTDSTQCSNTKNHDWRCQKQKHQDRQEHRKTNVQKQRDRRNGRVVLPLFQESTKEGALTYTDWRLEVEEYITKKYPGPKIKEAMFTSLEGKAKRNYQACDERGDLSPEKILEKMDMIYRTSVSFRDLNAKLCRLKQGAQESPKDYYEWMVDISVALKEYHGDWFQPRELARMKKQCFFAGFWENYKYLVSHLKDQDDVDPVLMLKEIRECDESWYPANTSHPPPRVPMMALRKTLTTMIRRIMIDGDMGTTWHEQWMFRKTRTTMNLIPYWMRWVRRKMMMSSRTGHTT